MLGSRDRRARCFPPGPHVAGPEYVVVHVPDSLRIALRRESARDLPVSTCSDFGGALRPLEQIDQGGGKALRISRRHQEAGLAILDNLGRATRPARDDRPPQGHGLDDDASKGLRVDRGVHDDIEHRQDIGHVGAEAGEDDSVADAELPREIS